MNCEFVNRYGLVVFVSLSVAIAPVAFGTAVPRAQTATPGSKKPQVEAPQPKSTSETPHAGVRLAAKERYELFVSLAALLKELDSRDFVAGAPAGTGIDGHPLAQYLGSSLNGFDAEAGSIDIVALADSVYATTRRMSPAFEDTTTSWMEEALWLANGLYRLGLTGDAVEWLKTVDEFSNSPVLRASARRLLVYHYTLTADSAAVEELSLSWRPALTRGKMGRRATLALLASLYAHGFRDRLRDIAARYPQFQTCGKFYEAHYAVLNNDNERASDLIDDLLWFLEKDERNAYPPSMKLASLILAADIDWITGLDAIARKEYRLLSTVDHPFARAWSQFMLGSIAMYNTDYASARERFGRLCETGEIPVWKELACAMERHSFEMIEILKGMD